MQDTLRTFIPKISIDGVELVGDIQAGLTINLGSCGSDEFSIGTCFIPSITASLTGCSTHLQDKEILLEMGLVLEDGEVAYQNVGYFTVERPTTDKFQTSFTAYGRLMNKAGGIYISELSYPATIVSVLDEIKSNTGLNIVLHGLQADGSIAAPIVGEVYREALMRIAGLLGGFVTENGNGDVVISKFELNKAVTVDTDLCYSWPETNDLEYEVVGIGVIVSEDGQDDEGNAIKGKKYYSSTDANVIIQNPYMTAELFETCKSNIVGFSYMPAKVEFLGDIRLEPWDSVVLVDDDSDTGIDIPCMNITHVWDGGLVTTITAPGKTATEDSSSFGGPLAKMIDRTYQRLLLAEQVIAKKVSADYVSANYATIDNLTAVNASIEELEAKSLTVDTVDAKIAEFVNANIGDLDATYVRTDKLNVDTAWVNDLLVKGKILTDDITAATGTFTKYLTGVKIYGDLIEANTLRAETLILKGTDGIYRRMNIDALGEATVDSDQKYSDGIDGSVLVKESITADKISTTSLEAICAKIGGFDISANALHNGTTSLAGSDDSVYLGTDGISCGFDFAVTKEGFVAATGAAFQAIALYDSIAFRTGRDNIITDLSDVQSDTSIGSIWVIDTDDYDWASPPMLRKGLACSAAFRFNNQVTIDDDLLVNGTTKFGKLEGVSSTGARTGSIVIGNMAIVFDTVSITTGTSVLEGLYSGLTDISFGVKFKQAPAIITNWAGNYANMHSTGAFSADATGATIWGRLVNPSSTRTIQWVAIGEIA